jgi:5-methylcytosine-specific restriction endonuclease McrA
MSLERPLESLSDDELLRGLAHVLSQSRRTEADLVAHIAEVETRRLYVREASPSMFAYCTNILHLSEAEAYLRITAARAALKHPPLLAMLADGRLHLSGIAKLAPHLTRENEDSLLSRAVHKSKRQIEELLAELAPRPDVPSVLRKLPGRPISPHPEKAPTVELVLDGVPASDQAEVPAVELGLGGVPSPDAAPRPVPAPPALVQPLSPSRYKVQFTAGAELCDKLERLRALLRPEVPDGDLAAIIEKAVTEKLERLEARRFARTRSARKDPVRRDPTPSSRHIPAAVRRAVYRRDQGRCCFVDAQGRRCPERHRLEYHHRHPFALGGGHDPANVCLLCPSHNRYLAELDYGRKALSRHWSRRHRRPFTARSGSRSPSERSGERHHPLDTSNGRT